MVRTARWLWLMALLFPAADAAAQPTTGPIPRFAVDARGSLARFKQDLVPGHEIPGWFKITKPGDYEIPCAELCGFGHSGMKGMLHALPQAEYEAWLRETKAAPVAPAKTS